MAQNWTVGTKIALGFGLSLAILAVVGAVTYRTTDMLIENNRMVTHTHQVLETIAHVLSSLKDAETGQRGYLLTGEEGYLEPWQAAQGPIRTAMADLRELTADNPHQQKRLDEALPLVNAKLAELLRTIELRRSQGAEAALRVVLSGEGKQYMDGLRRLCSEMDGEERELLRDRGVAAEASASAAKTTILGGVLLGLAIMVVAAFVITRSLSEQLTAAIASIRSSSAELEAAAAQQASGSREQSSAAAEVSTTIRELLSTSKQIAESAQRVARVADETAAGARRGDHTVQRAQEAIHAIKRQVDVIVGHMLELGKKSQQAGGILEIINELAEQTNILAINATIEAAGAGESGKRFAVVADEIRRLAERVGGSTKEIRGLIEDIRSAVNSTVMATEGGTKAVDAGTTQFSEVTAAFKQILERAIVTTDAAREIEISTKQQATAVEQVNVAIANVAQATKQTEASSSQTLQTVTQLTTLSRGLLQIVRRQAA
ncbi:MAG TPA: CHASE3 domain-containing protein [Polyangiaceae bacterium]|nr:CHASE3 domain-containing protein [Polyangiaceae bacterium]